MRFEAERLVLAQAFESVSCVIEHVGSTAVPELAAKPIIDIMLGVHSLADIEARIETMGMLDYEYMPQHENVMPERRYFAKPVVRPRYFHVHAVVLDGAFWNEHLIFRDALRANPKLAQSYASLKLQLAAEFGEDREGYTNAKGSFIRSVICGAPLFKTGLPPYIREGLVAPAPQFNVEAVE